MANVARSTIIRYACLIRRKTRRSWKKSMGSRVVISVRSCRPGLRNVCTILAGTLQNSASSKSGRLFWSRSLSPKRSLVMKTTRIFLRWSGKWIFVNSNTTPRTILMPTVIRAHCAAQTRGLWSSLRCLKHRLKCCILC